jgi:hypothetical protein
MNAPITTSAAITPPHKTPAPGTAPHTAAQVAKLTPVQRVKVEDALCAAVANGATDKRIATVSLALVGALALLNEGTVGGTDQILAELAHLRREICANTAKA